MGCANAFRPITPLLCIPQKMSCAWIIFLYTSWVRKVLVAWVGRTDLRAPAESEEVGLGPIAQALDARAFDEVFLLSDYDETDGRRRT